MDPIKQPTECAHEEFEAAVDVNRLTEKEGGGVSNFSADIRITCVQCGTPFHFIGVEQGLSFRRPMASADSLELRAPIGPGPLSASGHQTFEVAATQLPTDDEQDAPILASSDDPSPAEVSDAEFERRAAEELTKEEPNDGNSDAKQ
jgi:hypothetical protein